MSSFEIFKTNVQDVATAKKLILHLLKHFPGAKIHFDLEDIDRILRMEGNEFHPKKIVSLMEEEGFQCELLE